MDPLQLRLVSVDLRQRFDNKRSVKIIASTGNLNPKLQTLKSQSWTLISKFKILHPRP